MVGIDSKPKGGLGSAANSASLGGGGLGINSGLLPSLAKEPHFDITPSVQVYSSTQD